MKDRDALLAFIHFRVAAIGQRQVSRVLSSLVFQTLQFSELVRLLTLPHVISLGPECAAE